MSLDEFSFTFNGIGEYLLLKYSSPSENISDFEIQARLELAGQVEGSNRSEATAITALAMRAERGAIIEV